MTKYLFAFLLLAAPAMAADNPPSWYGGPNGNLGPQVFPLNMNGNQINNLGTPTASADAVTKSYADGLSSGSAVAGYGILKSPSNVVSVDTAAVLAANTTNFAGTALTSITGVGTQARALNMGTHLINNVTDPASAQDAATKNYVDNNTPLTVPDKLSRLATTAALPANLYANGSSGVGATLTGTGLGALTVDSVATAVGDRILVKNEVDSTHNGLYSVTTTAGGAFYVLTRTIDFNQPAEMIGGTLIIVDSGTVNVDQLYVLIATITAIGTDNIVFTRISIPNGAASGANADISSLAGAGAGVTFSTSVTFVSSITVKSELTISSDVAAVSGSTWVLANVSFSTSAQSKYPSLKFDLVTGVPYGSAGSSKTYIGGNIGSLDWTQITAATTTQTQNVKVVFATMTAPGDIQWNEGDRLRVVCTMLAAVNGNTKTWTMRYNGDGGIVLNGATGHTQSGSMFTQEVVLKYVAAGSWTAIWKSNNGTQGDTGPANTTGSPSLAITETSGIPINCGCSSNGTTAGDCSFSDMTMDYLPRGK